MCVWNSFRNCSRPSRKTFALKSLRTTWKWSVMMKMVSGDESLGYGYDPETKQQSLQWKPPDEPRPKKARQSRSHVKSILIIFLDCEGVVHYEFAPRIQMINKKYYVEVLKRLHDAVKRKRPRFWSRGGWLFHHDNAPAHSSNLVQQFLAKHKIVQLRQPPYSPDIAPCDFRMFPKLKMVLKGYGSTTSRRFRGMRRAS